MGKCRSVNNFSSHLERGLEYSHEVKTFRTSEVEEDLLIFLFPRTTLPKLEVFMHMQGFRQATFESNFPLNAPTPSRNSCKVRKKAKLPKRTNSCFEESEGIPKMRFRNRRDPPVSPFRENFYVFAVSTVSEKFNLLLKIDIFSDWRN